MRSFEWYLLRWLVYVAHLVDGLLGTLTGGFWTPGCTLSAELHFLDYCERDMAIVRAGDRVCCRGQVWLVTCIDEVTSQIQCETVCGKVWVRRNEIDRVIRKGQEPTHAEEP